MYTEIAIAECALIFSILVEVAVVLEAALGVLGISKRVGAAVERVSLRLRILLQVRVLGGGKVSRGGIVWKRGYTDIIPS